LLKEGEKSGAGGKYYGKEGETRTDDPGLGISTIDTRGNPRFQWVRKRRRKEKTEIRERSRLRGGLQRRLYPQIQLSPWGKKMWRPGGY